MILPMTGQSASTGKQEKAGAELYIAEHGDKVAGKTIKLAHQGRHRLAADITKRLAQELIANDHAVALMGFGLTPLAFAVAPIATEAKVPEIVTAAATAVITEKSPFIVRTSFTLPQASTPMADWAVKNGIKKVVTIVTDYGPGIDAEKWFGDTFKKDGGEIVESIRVPLKNPDFAPFLQRAKDDKPDAVFVFVPSGFGALFMKEFVEQGLAKAGHQADRHRRRDRRRSARRHGRGRARRRDDASLFRRPRFAGEQGVRRRLREGQRLPPEFHGGGGL